LFSSTREPCEERLGPNLEKVFPIFASIGVNLGRISGVDAIDRKILAELQQDGRLTLTELAERRAAAGDRQLHPVVVHAIA
jgi:hypothetical protein